MSLFAIGASLALGTAVGIAVGGVTSSSWPLIWIAAACQVGGILLGFLPKKK